VCVNAVVFRCNLGYSLWVTSLWSTQGKWWFHSTSVKWELSGADRFGILNTNQKLITHSFVIEVKINDKTQAPPLVWKNRFRRDFHNFSRTSILCTWLYKTFQNAISFWFYKYLLNEVMDLISMISLTIHAEIETHWNFIKSRYEMEAF